MTGKYLLFANDHYYPCGGMSDYQGSFPTYWEARAVGDGRTLSYGVSTRDFDWYQIVYHPTMKEVHGEVTGDAS